VKENEAIRVKSLLKITMYLYNIYNVALVFPAVSSNQDGVMTVQPPTSPGQNSGPSMYSRDWIVYTSVPFPRLADDNRSYSSVHVNNSAPSTGHKRASPSSDLSSDRHRQSVSSHDQLRLSPPFDYGEEITYSPYPSLADVGSPSSPSSSSDSDLRVRSSADSDPGISSVRPVIIGLNDQKVKKERGSPMILFDEHGEMHRNYYTPYTTPRNKYR